MTNHKENIKTELRFWDSYWITHDQKSKKKPISLQVKELYKIFHRFFPVNENFQVLEIGGAYGEFLLYLHQHFHYTVSSLDYSPSGNEVTRQKFQKIGVNIRIFERDLFGDLSDLPRFDIVFSLGFIEHFENPLPVVKKHLELLKPGGFLLLGVPNLGGIYEKILDRIAPSYKETHNLSIMDLDNWEVFEYQLHLEPVYKAYIGGFEPLNMKKLEIKKNVAFFLYSLVTVLTLVLSFRFSFLRRFNSRFWSGYMVGIYRRK